MLEFETVDKEIYDGFTESFVEIPATLVKMEHSLVSISKWESIWHTPFLTKREKTREEQISYVRCMLIGEYTDYTFIEYLNNSELTLIQRYITDPATATTINNPKQKASREIMTSELIYYYMVAGQIPFECENWHLNRLMTLINICGLKNSPSKKRSTKDILSRNKALNDARRKNMGTTG